MRANDLLVPETTLAPPSRDDDLARALTRNTHKQSLRLLQKRSLANFKALKETYGCKSYIKFGTLELLEQRQGCFAGWCLGVLQLPSTGRGTVLMGVQGFHLTNVQPNKELCRHQHFRASDTTCGAALHSMVVPSFHPCPVPAASKSRTPGWTNTAQNQTELSV